MKSTVNTLGLAGQRHKLILIKIRLLVVSSSNWHNHIHPHIHQRMVLREDALLFLCEVYSVNLWASYRENHTHKCSKCSLKYTYIWWVEMHTKCELTALPNVLFPRTNEWIVIKFYILVLYLGRWSILLYTFYEIKYFLNCSKVSLLLHTWVLCKTAWNFYSVSGHQPCNSALPSCLLLFAVNRRSNLQNIYAAKVWLYVISSVLGSNPEGSFLFFSCLQKMHLRGQFSYSDHVFLIF